MIATIQRIPILFQDQIAALSCEIRQKESRVSGPDPAYLLQAEWQLRAICQQGNGGVKSQLPPPRKVTAPTQKNAMENL